MEFDVIKIMTHPKFNSRNLQNDIAMLRVDPAIPLGVYPTIATACLPDKLINQNLTCFVSGWGRNDFDVKLNTAILMRYVNNSQIPYFPLFNSTEPIRPFRERWTFQLLTIRHVKQLSE